MKTLTLLEVILSSDTSDECNTNGWTFRFKDHMYSGVHSVSCCGSRKIVSTVSLYCSKSWQPAYTNTPLAPIPHVSAWYRTKVGEMLIVVRLAWVNYSIPHLQIWWTVLPHSLQMERHLYPVIFLFCVSTIPIHKGVNYLNSLIYL